MQTQSELNANNSTYIELCVFIKIWYAWGPVQK